jgi:hypothetical protein
MAVSQYQKPKTVSSTSQNFGPGTVRFIYIVF